MDEQLTFEFEQRPTIGIPRASLDGQASLPLHAVLSCTAAGIIRRGAERLDQQDFLG